MTNESIRSSFFWNIDIGKPDAHLRVSFGEEFSSNNGNHSYRGGGPSAIELVRKMVPHGSITLASNTTLRITVTAISLTYLVTFLLIK